MVRVRVKKCSLLVGLSLLLGANIVYILFHPGIVFISTTPAQVLNSYRPTPLSLVTPVKVLNSYHPTPLSKDTTVKPIENRSLIGTNLSSTIVPIRTTEQILLFNVTRPISRKKRRVENQRLFGTRLSSTVDEDWSAEIRLFNVAGLKSRKKIPVENRRLFRTSPLSTVFEDWSAEIRLFNMAELISRKKSPVENRRLFRTSPSSTVDEDWLAEIRLFNVAGQMSRKKIEEDDKDFSGPGETSPSQARDWFLSGGWKMPTPKRSDSPRMVWPGEAPGSDRIKAQLMYIPPESQVHKRILVYNGLASWGQTKPGQAAFQGCPVNTCHLTTDKSESVRADAILYKDHFVHPGHPKQHRQVWILYMLECPYHTQHMKYNDVFNWTATYRWDSDIVTPYEKWVYHDENIKQLPKPIKDFAANKTKQVAWFVSNCGARNSRLQYAHELQKFIGVDIFGACGTKKCPRSTQFKCFSMLDQNYKFYLAFENSNCKDYITEKFFVNGLGRNILPIVMGARKEDYERAAPLRSFIHVDDFATPKELAEYLHKLDNDDNLYNDYFRWKGTGEFINTFFFCRLCAMLHDNYPSKSYRDINEWWRGPGTCTSASWKPKINWFQSMAIKA